MIKGGRSQSLKCEVLRASGSQGLEITKSAGLMALKSQGQKAEC